eukprot:10434840-Prorocentrum_lima.AAC.1
MTSSLVGSEMCIRDRLSRPKCHVCHFPGQWSQSSNWGWYHGPGAIYAVSYTHLTLPTICSV